MKKYHLTLLSILCCAFLTACADGRAADNRADYEDVPVMQELPAENLADDSGSGTDDDAAQQPTDVLLETPETKENTNTASENKAEEAQEEELLPVSTPARLSANLYDFQVSIDGTVYQFPMQYADMEALGWTYGGDSLQTLDVNQYVPLQEWIKDDVSISTKLANLSEVPAAFSDCMVSGITIERHVARDCDWKILLPNGIEWGVSNADDIKEAYGEPAYEYDGDTYYKMIYQDGYYREIALYVYKDTDVLQQIDMENLTKQNENDF
ncbi:MAG: hypothetical protein NC231_07050 [Bacillus sp. (in: Bacteria)]|nr:hypothetical protein [Bacillus sp. (in: firmicutes)]MCM1425929.1 hypothetical protein [Eubacterium sp.]